MLVNICSLVFVETKKTNYQISTCLAHVYSSMSPSVLLALVLPRTLYNNANTHRNALQKRSSNVGLTLQNAGVDILVSLEQSLKSNKHSNVQVTARRAGRVIAGPDRNRVTERDSRGTLFHRLSFISESHPGRQANALS